MPFSNAQTLFMLRLKYIIIYFIKNLFAGCKNRQLCCTAKFYIEFFIYIQVCIRCCFVQIHRALQNGSRKVYNIRPRQNKKIQTPANRKGTWRSLPNCIQILCLYNLRYCARREPVPYNLIAVQK